MKLYRIPYYWSVTASIVGTGPQVTVCCSKTDHNPRCCDGTSSGKYVYASYKYNEWGGQLLNTGVFTFDPNKYNKLYLYVRSGWDHKNCSCPIFINFSDKDDSKIIAFNVRKDAEHLPLVR